MGAKVTDEINEETDINSLTPLKLACKHGHLQIVELLISRGAKVNEEINKGVYLYQDDRNSTLCTPLYFAAQGGHLDVVKLLLQHGAEVNELCERENTALMAAAEHGHLEVVKILVENGAQLEIASDFDGTAVLGASCAGHVEILEYLLQHGANPHSEGDGYSSLAVATKKGYTRVVQLLLEYGAGVEDVAYLGVKALNAAVANNHTDIMALLIKYGANIDIAATCDIGENLYHTIKGWKGDDSQKWEFMSSLHYAIINRYIDTVWILALAGVPTNIPYKEKKQKEQTVWELCGDDMSMRSALMHIWSPQDHFRHPQCVRNAIVSVLLIAKRQHWGFDSEVMCQIFQYIAYGWWC
eukprot:Phypoly_transcript_08802.p1 GENE.Phypoly_transcript_08802~~Phypoly_transcript_08802.p1  ORF type:complete len:355 (+),score=48.37 Phypoly_transcript_08802:216-1280(+)